LASLFKFAILKQKIFSLGCILKIQAVH